MIWIKDGENPSPSFMFFIIKRVSKMQNKKEHNTYQEQRIISATPNELISYIFDVAIAGCGKNDSIKAGKAVRELMKSLNFEYKEMALTFYNVYRYINHNIINGNFSHAREILVDIKTTWDKAMKSLN